MESLRTLRMNNPDLPLYSVSDPEFRRFGRVIEFDASALITACKQTATMPDAGSRYVPAMPALEALPAHAQIQHMLLGESSCQIGCCWGYNTMLNCLEYHRTSEHNIAVSDLVLLLAAQQDMDGLDLPEGKIAGFFVAKGTTIEVYASTLHFCPCQTDHDGFRCIVVLPRSTNLPLDHPKPKTGDGRLLWAKNKWLAHPDNQAVLQRGAYPGLHGMNFGIKF